MEENFDLKKTSGLLLHDAIKNADGKSVKNLVNIGIDVNHKNSLGQTPLHLAIAYGNLEIVNLLLSASNNINLHIEDKDGCTPLDYASDCNNLKMVKILLKAQTECAADKNLSTISYQKALHFAIKKHHISFFESLLAQQVNINLRDSNGCTPLHMATYSKQSESYLKIVEILLKFGADANAQDDNGKTPLHYFVRQANEKAVHLLLSYQPNVNIKDNNGGISLNEAVHKKDFRIAQLLINCGADTNNIKTRGVTVLHEACMFYNEKIIKLLVKNGANIEALDSNGLTPSYHILRYFSYSSRFERPRRILTFLFKYANINIANRFLKTFDLDEDMRKVCVEHIAKLQALDLPIPQSIFNILSESTVIIINDESSIRAFVC